MRKISMAMWQGFVFCCFITNVALADNCSSPGDCLETAGYNATIGLVGGLLGLLAALLGNRITEMLRIHLPWIREWLPPRELQGLEIPPDSNSEIRYELPENGIGYTTYNRNDTKRNYPYSLDPTKPNERQRIPDQIGTKDTIERIIELGRGWYEAHSDRPLQVGDISLAGGVDTPDHKAHQNGRDVDIRPLRNDDQHGDSASLTYHSDAYDRQLTKEFIELVLARYPTTTFHFNDSQITEDPTFKGVVTTRDEHDNHIHIMFKETEPELSQTEIGDVVREAEKSAKMGLPL